MDASADFLAVGLIPTATVFCIALALLSNSTGR